MKISTTEKRWLLAVLLFYVLYNLPFVPRYGDARGLLIHAALTLVPLWASIYVGLVRVFRSRRLRSKED